MASITSSANGTKRLQFVDTDGIRKSIYLGKISKRDADSFKIRLEALLSCKIVGTSPDRDLSIWVTTISPKLQHDLAKFSLIDTGNLPQKPTKETLAAFLAQYVDKRGKGKKPATIIVWKQVIASLEEHLPGGVRLSAVTIGDAKDWIDSMRVKKLAETTIHKRLTFAKQFFDYALEHRKIRQNPFSTIKLSKPKPKSNVEVTRETIAAIMKHCDPTWQAIISLSRFGGLRCPSEVLSLKWSDVDFEKGVISIPEPKVEHHSDRGHRLCPLFPEVRKALESLQDNKNKGEYVIDRDDYRATAITSRGWANVNLRTRFLKRLKSAGVEPWPRLFHSMRASRQTELEREFGLPAACSWLGNTEKVAKESYLLIFEDTWQEAIGNKSSAQSSAVNPNKVQKPSEPKSKRPTKKHDSK